MKWDTLEEEPCSLARTVARDRRPLDAADPARMFSAHPPFRRVSVGARHHPASARRAAEEAGAVGVLRRIPYQRRPKRHEYILTQKGLDLYPIIMAMVHWGDTHMADERGRPLLHEHKNCGKVFDPVMVCSECRRAPVRQGSRHAARSRRASGRPAAHGGEKAGVERTLADDAASGSHGPI